MRRLIAAALLVIGLCFSAYADNDSSSTVDYKICVTADGDSYLIFGNNNQVQLVTPSAQCGINVALQTPSGYTLELVDTEIYTSIGKVMFKRIVLFIDNAGYVTVLSAQ